MRERTQAKFTAKRADLRNHPWSPSCLCNGFRVLHLKLSEPSLGSHPHNIRYNFDTIPGAALCTKITAPPRTDAEPVRASSHPTWQLGGRGKEEGQGEK